MTTLQARPPQHPDHPDRNSDNPTWGKGQRYLDDSDSFQAHVKAAQANDRRVRRERRRGRIKNVVHVIEILLIAAVFTALAWVAGGWEW